MNQKVMFKYGEWEIRDWNIYDGSFIYHDPCNTSIESTLLSQNPHCYKCKSKVPDEVVGTWILLNFDRIQEGFDPLKLPGG